MVGGAFAPVGVLSNDVVLGYGGVGDEEVGEGLDGAKSG